MDSSLLLLLSLAVSAVAAAVVQPHASSHASHVTPSSNPCRTTCLTDSASAECATCCRTARHRVPWNCANPLGPHGDRQILRDAKGGVPAACCTGDWSSACWNEPSAANYDHSCDMCASVFFEGDLPNCSGYYNDSNCWTGGVVPTSSAGCRHNSVVRIPSGYVASPGGMGSVDCTFIVERGAVFNSGQFYGAPGLVVPIFLLGTGLQLTGSIGADMNISLGAATAEFDVANPAVITLNSISQPPHPPPGIGASPVPGGRVVLTNVNLNPDMPALDVLSGTGRVVLEVRDNSRFSSIRIAGGNQIVLLGPTTLPAGVMIQLHDIDSNTSFIASGITFQNQSGIAVTGAGAASVRIEALNTTTFQSGSLVDMTLAATGSVFVSDAARFGAGVNAANNVRSAPAIVTCSTPCLSGGLGLLCQSSVSTCTGANCVGACKCGPPSTDSVYTPPYSPVTGCPPGANCAMPCLGGSACAGTDMCDGICPATATGHWTVNCQTRDGTCTDCYGTQKCSAGDQCGPCPPGFSGLSCQTFVSVAPALASGSGRAVFTFATTSLAIIRARAGGLPQFVTSVTNGVASAAAVVASRVTVAAIAPSTDGLGVIVTVDITPSNSIADFTPNAALVQLSANLPASFGAQPVTPSSLSCPGYASCADANFAPLSGDAASLYRAPLTALSLVVASVFVALRL